MSFLNDYFSIVKKRFALKALGLVLFGFLFFLFVVVILGVFKYDPVSILFGTVFVITFSAIILSYFGYIIVSISDHFFRPSRIQRIAKKYNLNYIKILPDKKTNIIEGKINGKSILIYDYIDLSKVYELSLIRWDYAWPGTVARSVTIISIDGVIKKIRGFYAGFGSIKKIDSILADLSKEK